MTLGTFILVTGLIAVFIVALSIILDIDDFRTFTVGEYILMFITCWIPIFNMIWIFFGGLTVIVEIFSRVLFDRDWFKKVMTKRPFSN